MYKACSMFVILLLSVPAAGDWPGFRGDGTSHAPPGDYPITWSPKENVAWTLDLPGYGQSAPVIATGTVYVTAVEGPNKETNHIVALDAVTGEQRWMRSFPSSAPARNTPMIGRAAPTSSADESGVFAFFESGDLIAISPAGEVRWKRSLTTDFGPFTNRHGLGSSLAQTDEALFLLVDQEANGYLLAIAKATGETLWKTDRQDRTGWSSPVIGKLCGVSQIVISAGGAVDGYDAGTGERLWTYEGLSGNTVPSPAITGDYVVIGARLGRRGGDVPTVSKSNRCLRVLRDGKRFRAETVWAAEKVLSHYASPLVVGANVYYTNNVGVLFRLDAVTGEVLDRVRAGRPCWATPVAAGGHMYLFGDDGTTAVFEAGERLSEVAMNELWNDASAPQGDPYAVDFKPAEGPPGKSEAELIGAEPAATSGPPQTSAADAEYDRPTVYGVAAAYGAFFVRTGTRLYCLRQD